MQRAPSPPLPPVSQSTHGLTTASRFPGTTLATTQYRAIRCFGGHATGWYTEMVKARPDSVVVADNTGSAGATYTDTSLTPNTRYVYSIKARNALGLSPVSASVNAETPRDPQGVPATPSGLAVDSQTHNSITLSWDDPGDSAIQELSGASAARQPVRLRGIR